MEPRHEQPDNGTPVVHGAPVGESGEELVVLCGPDGRPTGSARKAGIHTHATPLHRAFSCYLLDASDQVLLTRRALSKATWPGVWTNSVCGHPQPGESESDAARRRLHEELGIDAGPTAAFETVLPTFTYRATDASGVVENEFCPVLVLRIDPRPDMSPNPDEVAEWAWTPLARLRQAVEGAPFAFSPWMVRQLDGWNGPG